MFLSLQIVFQHQNFKPHYPKSPISSYLHANNKLDIDYPFFFFCLQISYSTHKTLGSTKSISMIPEIPLTEFLF